MSDVKTDLSEQSQPELPAPEQAWEEVYAGAYVPIRVRGSWRGGILG